MNRRQAIELLTVLPETTRLSLARPAPDDVIVVECDSYISQELAAQLQTQLEAVWPGRRCVVLGKGMRLKFAQDGTP